MSTANETRKILHIDMDAFFASIEQRDNPELRGKPIVVGGKPNTRGVIAAASYEARQYGLRSAMPSSRAVQLCPEVVFVSSRFQQYREVSKHVHQIFSDYTDLIEPLSLDEAYLDVTDTLGLNGTATKIAQSIRQRIQKELNLTASAGVSYNKFIAKIASDINKPNGICVVPPDKGPALLASLPIGRFHGVGKVTERRMMENGISTGQDLKALSLVELQALFGRSAQYYYNIVRGIDHRPVRTSRVRKSIGSETTFHQDIDCKTTMLSVLEKLASEVSDSLLKKESQASTVTLKVRYSDFTTITRQISNQHIKTAIDIMAALPLLLEKTDINEKKVRLLGVSVSQLSPRESYQPSQLILF